MTVDRQRAPIWDSKFLNLNFWRVSWHLIACQFRLLSPEPMVVEQPKFTWVEERTFLCNHLEPLIGTCSVGALTRHVDYFGWFVTRPLRWPAASIVARSHPSPSARTPPGFPRAPRPQR